MKYNHDLRHVESVISANYSYDTEEQKHELMRAYCEGAEYERAYAKIKAENRFRLRIEYLNDEVLTERFPYAVEPYEGDSAYIRGYRAALGEIFRELNQKRIIRVCPPSLHDYLLIVINALAEQTSTTQMLDDKTDKD